MAEVAEVEVIDFDQQRAQRSLRKIEEVFQAWATSTVQLADVAYLARKDQCWRVDEQFMDARASGAIAPGPEGSWSRVWLGWKFNRAGRTVEQLADYGELRAIIGFDPRLPMLAEPEGAARPMAKLLRPRLLKSETLDIEERNQAIRKVWEDALGYTEHGTPAEAISMVPRALKKSAYKPLRRLAEPPSPAQDQMKREQAVLKGKKMVLDGGYLLLRSGAKNQLRELLKELSEAVENDR